MNRPNRNMSLVALAVLAGSLFPASFDAAESPVPPRRRPRVTGGGSLPRRRFTSEWEPGCWKGDGVAPAPTRQMRRMAARKARKGGAK